MICPLISRPCLLDDCAWYIEAQEKCAILVLAEAQSLCQIDKDGYCAKHQSFLCGLGKEKEDKDG